MHGPANVSKNFLQFLLAVVFVSIIQDINTFLNLFCLIVPQKSTASYITFNWNLYCNFSDETKLPVKTIRPIDLTRHEGLLFAYSQ
jgi:hypothetical protein